MAASPVTVTTQELGPAAPVTEQAYSGVPLLTPTGESPIKGGLNIGGHTLPVIGQLHPVTHPLVSRELARFNVDVAALSETRIPGEGQITEVGSGYTFFWKGKNPEDHHSQGVGFAVKTQLVKAHNLTPHAINERITSLRLPLPKNQFITLVSVYAPTLDAEDHVKGAFYQQLDTVISQIPAGDRLLLLGDFNARVGREHELWHNIIGRRQQHKNEVLITRSMPGADDCWTDHRLLITKLKLTIKRKPRNIQRNEARRRYDNGKLKDPDTSRAFLIAIQQNLPAREPSIDTEWTNIRGAINEAARTVVGYQSKQHQDWFDNNDEDIKPLTYAKRKARPALDQDTKSQPNKAKYAQSHSVKPGFGKCKMSGGSKWRKTYKHTAAGTLLAADNNILTEDNEIQTRWEEHFNTLLNRNSSAQQDFLRNMPQHPPQLWMALPPTFQEFDAALKHMRQGKAAGPDNIPTELLTHGGLILKTRLHFLILKAREVIFQTLRPWSWVRRPKSPSEEEDSMLKVQDPETVLSTEYSVGALVACEARSLKGPGSNLGGLGI
ncbi:uncharacterized protein LOC143026011 [Oratosquilla oratoria]|uniref:uncharacterized protein LOC143026011 n=1 Tax=Oratosquilla oratoria TaxID=337810 RepID=UPI003F76A525